MIPLFAMADLPEHFWIGVVGSVIFGLLGIGLLLLGYKLFDWLTPKIDFQGRLHESAVATSIVIAAFFLAVAHIISSVVR